MTVFYRLCDIPSTNPSPVYQDAKLKLNELCLRSFVLAFRDVKPKVVFICDYCPEKYKDLIEKEVPFEKEIIFTTLGINGSCLKQYELAEEIEDDVFLFQECDYVYRPSVGTQVYEAIKEFTLFSPYDHLNFYIDRNIHSPFTEINLFNNQHYRTAERNTMTFGMTKKAFEENKSILKKWGYLDNEVWYEMRANGYDLHVPIPAMATHMVKDYLAPCIPWEIIWKTLT